MKSSPTLKSLERSRPFGVAAELVGGELDQETVLSRTVILTAGACALDSPNGQFCWYDAIRLLPRIAGQVQVVLPSGAPADVAATTSHMIDRAWSQGAVRLLEASAAAWSTATATLSIGSANPGARDAIVVGNVGWTAYLGQAPDDRGFLDHPNPVSALLAASLGASEVFKRVYGVPEDITPWLRDARFNLFTMNSEDALVTPCLPDRIQLPDTLLLGAGAIGNAIALLLKQLGASGNLITLDKDRFGPENRATCMLFDDPTWLDMPKSTAIAEFLSRQGMKASDIHATIEHAIAADLLKHLSVDLVLGALDDVAARREVQRLWPALLVDGGINSRGAAALSYRAGDATTACMRCWFPEPARQVASLSADERNLHDQRRQICANVGDIVSQQALGLSLSEGFKPSVPFVASASAALVIAQAVKGVLWPSEGLHGMVQLESLFLGFSTANRLRRPPSATCECFVHQTVIRRLAEARVAKPSARIAAA